MINWPELLIGLFAGWAITHWYDHRNKKQAEEYKRMLVTLLVAAEKAGNVRLARDEQGRVTGGEMIVIEPKTSALGLQGYAPTVQIRAKAVGTVASIKNQNHGNNDDDKNR